MRVEITEERLSDTDRVTGRHHVLEEGDRITVSDQCGEWWCSQGWAKDLDGNVETAERKVRQGQTVNPDSITHDHEVDDG